MMKILRRIGGGILFMVGVLALVLPFVPGWLLIALGLYVLSIDSPGIERRIRALRERFPWLNRALGKQSASSVSKDETPTDTM